MAQKPLTPAKPGPTSAKDAALKHTFLKDDFPIIRKAAITFGVCLAIAGILTGVSQFFLLKLEAINLQAQSDLAQAQGKYSAATNEKNQIREFQPMYLELVQRGFVGEEKRLDAIEFIRADSADLSEQDCGTNTPLLLKSVKKVSMSPSCNSPIRAVSLLARTSNSPVCKDGSNATICCGAISYVIGNSLRLSCIA